MYYINKVFFKDFLNIINFNIIRFWFFKKKFLLIVLKYWLFERPERTQKFQIKISQQLTVKKVGLTFNARRLCYILPSKSIGTLQTVVREFLVLHFFMPLRELCRCSCFITEFILILVKIADIKWRIFNAVFQ